ncbi:caspase-8-like [Maylandia zebra]|uniref:caspase-8-like n=1 Tax=Maylandia zebra TaxID=106582 RepID=UPI00403CCDB8
MSAKDIVRRNKTAIQTILSGDYRLILNKVYEKELITEREYNILKSIGGKDVEGHIVELVDKIMSKGDDTCGAFLNFLQTDEDIKTTSPQLKDLKNDILFLHDGSSQMETALDVFAQMEKKDLISDKNVSVLHEILQEIAPELAMIVENYIQGVPQQQQMLPPHRFFNTNESHLPLSVTETQCSCRGEIIYTDARSQPISLPDQSEYYTLTHTSHGLCVIINNETFTTETCLHARRGTQKDADALNTVFTSLGFKVLIHNNLTAAQIRNELRMYSKKNFVNDNALVVCVLSHGEKGCVFGTDGEKVFLKDLMLPFTSGRVPTLSGKPKLFFIEASQGDGYQKGYCPCSLGPQEDGRETQFFLEGNADPGRQIETVPSEADFLIGMATVEDFVTFRNTVTGCIYTQELCKQLTRSAESQEMDDILTVLTRVNREVSKGEYLSHKQMPEPRYTLTKKLVLKPVTRL